MAGWGRALVVATLVAQLAVVPDARAQTSEEIAAAQLVPKLNEQQLGVVTRFLTKIWHTYRRMLGGRVFEGFKAAFEKTGLSGRDHCEETMAALPSMPDERRVNFVRAMLGRVRALQAQGPAAVRMQLAQRVSIVHGDTAVGRHVSQNPASVSAVASVLTAPGVLDCVLVALLDRTRLIIYGTFFGVTFIGLSLLCLNLTSQAMWIVRMGASFTIPPALFAVNMFVFYLFYQKELDPVLELLTRGRFLG